MAHFVVSNLAFSKSRLLSRISRAGAHELQLKSRGLNGRKFSASDATFTSLALFQTKLPAPGFHLGVEK